MISDGKYRFTLQFPGETREQRIAGYLLTQSGRKKSAVVVKALNEYVARHPEVWKGGLNSNAATATVRPTMREAAPRQVVPTPEEVQIKQSRNPTLDSSTDQHLGPDMEPVVQESQESKEPLLEVVQPEPGTEYRQPQSDGDPASVSDAETAGDTEFQQAVLAMVADLGSFL